MQKEKLILPIAIILVMTLMVTFVVAEPVLQEPVAGSNWSTARDGGLNVTITEGASNEITTIVCNYSSTGGATSTHLITMYNGSSNQTSFSNTSITLPGTDSITYNISCHVYNNSEINKTLSVSNVGIDDTAPSCSASISETSVNIGRYFKYTISLRDATTDLDIKYCNITDADSFVDKGIANISLWVNNTLYKNTGSAGTYNITCVTVDRAGNSANCSDTVTVKTGGAPVEVGGTKESIFQIESFNIDGIINKIKGQDSKTIIIVIIVIVVLAVLLGKKK